MPSGQNSWSAISDSNRKENLLTVDGEAMLKKISRFKLSTWNYKGQDPKIFRHYGPMAQDFYNAFGHDAFGTIGCDTLINQQDFLGVSFSAIHALEKRTQKLDNMQMNMEALRKENADIKKENANIKKENVEIKKENADIKKENQDIKKELEEIKQLLKAK